MALVTVAYFGYRAYRRRVTVDCEQIKVMNEFSERHLQVEICLMTEKTAINRTGVEIFSKNLSVRNLTLNWNNKVRFLPENVHESFPNLVVFEAENCRVKQISRNNFRGLYRLKVVNLAGNLISNIDAGVFSENVELQIIDLSESESKSKL